MNQFTYSYPTKVYFGEKTAAESLKQELSKVGKTVMLAYGGGSIKKNGIYDDLKHLLVQMDKEVVDFSGIMPNPTYAKVQEGARLVQEAHVDFILAAGGGSVIDCCKVISAQAMLAEDIWDMEYKSGKFPIVGTAASFAILDPLYTASVPPMQVLSGAFDTLSHAMETYLGNSDQDNVSDDVALAVMRNTVINMRRLLVDINDMQARCNLMWDSAMAENGILKVGRLTDFQAHQIEHQLGAYTDCNHGQGLAVIHPAYYRHILKDAEEKFTRFAKEVFGADTAEGGLEALTAFIEKCGLPTRLSQLKSKVEITPEILRQVADTCNIIKCNPRELDRDEIYEILRECL